MEVALRSGSNKVRPLASRIRVLTAYRPQNAIADSTPKQTVVAQNTVLPNNVFPFAGGVTSQVAYARTSEVMQPMEVEPVVEAISKPVAKFNLTGGNSAIEVKAVQCPDAMSKKVGELFPNQKAGDLTVLNVTQKTQHDMSAWSPEGEIEWMALSSGFTESAMETCNALKSLGYWADFINPTSGHPYLSKSEAALNVTDNEYNSLGFDVSDMGCCKIVAHAKWGKNVFIGTIFTNAPAGILETL